MRGNVRRVFMATKLSSLLGSKNSCDRAGSNQVWKMHGILFSGIHYDYLSVKTISKYVASILV